MTSQSSATHSLPNYYNMSIAVTKYYVLKLKQGIGRCFVYRMVLPTETLCFVLSVLSDTNYILTCIMDQHVTCTHNEKN